MNELKKLQWIKPEMVKYPRIITEGGSGGSSEQPNMQDCAPDANFIAVGDCTGNTSCCCDSVPFTDPRCGPCLTNPDPCGNLM